MNKENKSKVVEELREQFQNTQAAFITHYKGLTVAQANTLRRSLEDAGAGYRVVKNTLAKLAIEGTDYEVLSDSFTGPVSVTFANTDPAAAAKAIAEFAKGNEALVIQKGALGGKLLETADIVALSKLPSREQLLGQLLSVMQGPSRGLVTVLSGVPRSFVQVLSAVQDKKAA